MSEQDKTIAGVDNEIVESEVTGVSEVQTEPVEEGKAEEIVSSARDDVSVVLQPKKSEWTWIEKGGALLDMYDVPNYGITPSEGVFRGRRHLCPLQLTALSEFIENRIYAPLRKEMYVDYFERDPRFQKIMCEKILDKLDEIGRNRGNVPPDFFTEEDERFGRSLLKLFNKITDLVYLTHMIACKIPRGY